MKESVANDALVIPSGYVQSELAFHRSYGYNASHSTCRDGRSATLVVAQPVGDSLITETGCAPQSFFAVVYGDIPVDYALEKIQEKAEPTLSGIATNI